MGITTPTENQFATLLTRHVKGINTPPPPPPEEVEVTDRFYGRLSRNVPVSEIDGQETWKALRQNATRAYFPTHRPPAVRGMPAPRPTALTYLLFTSKISKRPKENKNRQASNKGAIKVNDFSRKEEFILPVGGFATLQPQSKLIIRPLGVTSAVSLEGTFFKVAPDGKRSFMAQVQGIANQTASFFAKSRTSDRAIAAKIETGKASVSRKSKNKNGKEYLIAPNREIVYCKKGDRLQARIEESAQTAIDSSELLKMNFDEALPVRAFAALEKAVCIWRFTDEAFENRSLAQRNEEGCARSILFADGLMRRIKRRPKALPKSVNKLLSA